MSDVAIDAERALLEGLRESYEARGYKYVVNPPRELLPTPFGSYRPDAIALGPRSNVAIEVVSSPSPKKKEVIDRIAESVGKSAGWEMRVVYAPSVRADAEGLQKLSVMALKAELAEVSELTNSKYLRAGFVAAWSVLEAVIRALQPEEAVGRSLAPWELVQVLMEGGHISVAEGRKLRSLIRLRNSAIHGGLAEPIQEADTEYLIKLTRQLIDQLSPRPSSTPR